MGKPLVLIIDPDLSTRALVEASVDPGAVVLKVVRDVPSAREVLVSSVPVITLVDGGVDGASELLAEMDGASVVWLGDPGAATTASVVLPTPLDLVSLQLVLEQHLGHASSLREPEGPRDAAYQALETDRDAMGAELDILRHEGEETRRQMQEAADAARDAFDATVAQLKDELNRVTAELRTQRKTAEALQRACGEIEQAHGKLLQRHEAMKAERDAMAERARDVSLLREQLELNQRDHQRVRAALEARLAEATPPEPSFASVEEAWG